MNKVEIVDNQTRAYSICFVQDFALFKNYSILIFGNNYHILNNGFIKEQKDLRTIRESIDSISSYFLSKQRNACISILDDNLIAHQELLTQGYTRKSQDADIFFVLDIKKIPISVTEVKQEFESLELKNLEEFERYFSTHLHEYSATFLQNLKKAFAQSVVPYHFFVISDANINVGLTTLAVIGNAAYFMSAQVDTSYRRLGLYSLMNAARANEAKSKGCEYAVIETDLENKATCGYANKIGPEQSFQRYFYSKEVR